MTPTLYDRVRLAREGAAVERAHAHPHLMRYSVGGHSLDLVTLVTLTWQADHSGQLPSASLLVACAFHDVPERITGDLPSPVKDMLGEACEAMDRKVLAWLNVPTGEEVGVAPDADLVGNLFEEEIAYLQAADRIELVLWCLEEDRRGNSSFLPWAEGYFKHFAAHPAPPALMEVLHHAHMNRMQRLDDAALMEIVR